MRTKRILRNAFKNLWKFKLRSFLMMIGIVIGIIALTVIVSAGFGAKGLVTERVKKFGLESLMVTAGGGCPNVTDGILWPTYCDLKTRRR